MLSFINLFSVCIRLFILSVNILRQKSFLVATFNSMCLLRPELKCSIFLWDNLFTLVCVHLGSALVCCAIGGEIIHTKILYGWAGFTCEGGQFTLL